MKKFYITTALPYVNASPHLGFALEIIQADVLARYHRLLGEDVFFLTGTDEHGAKVVKAAKEAGIRVEELVNQNAAKFQDLAKALNISNTDFIRTTDKKRHWPAVKKVWLKLEKNGDIYKKRYKGLYCSGCEAFITKKDLRGGRCQIHKVTPEIIEEENYFFRLSKYGPQIRSAIRRNRLKIIPEGRRNEILKVLAELQDISVSRPRKDLKWGIPVPRDKEHTLYVWIDALTNYISALEYVRNGPKFKKYWPADVQCIGKDILRFHAAIWPGILLAIDLPLPKILFVHGFITVGGQKMSKSLKNVIDPFELINQYGADAVRYYLLREIPATEDGDFTYEKFEERYNADLAKGLGNLVARVTTLATRFKIYDLRFKIRAQETEIINKIWKDYRRKLDEFRFNDTLADVWSLISWCDKYIQDERLWETKNQKVIYELLFVLSNIASMLRPFLPETADKIFKQLGVKPTDKEWRFKVQKSQPLFPRR